MVDAIGIIANLSQNWVDLDRETIESNDLKKLKGYFLKCAKFLFEINKLPSQQLQNTNLIVPPNLNNESNTNLNININNFFSDMNNMMAFE